MSSPSNGSRASARVALVLGTGVAALAALVPAASHAADRAYPASPVPDRVVLNPTVTPERSQSFTWRTSGDVAAGSVEVLSEAGGPTIVVPSTVSDEYGEGSEGGNDYRVRHHTATATGLDPGQRYRYRVGSEQGWSPWRAFTTAAVEGAKPWRWLYFGDAQNGLNDRWPGNVRQAYERVPDAQLVLHAGDLINHPTYDIEWGDWFAAQTEELATVNTLATAGNHEYLYGTLESVDTSARRFRSHFRHPGNGPSADDNLAYYSDYQDVRFISLSTGLGIDLLALERQKQWLRDVLARNTRKWTVVMFHYPIYSAGIAGGGLTRGNPQVRGAWGPTLEEFDVDLVLQGHDHAYSRGYRTANGPAYVVSVLGPKYYDLTSETDNDWVDNDAVRVAAAQETSTYQAICVDGDRLSYESIVAAKGERSSTPKQVGETLDAFTIDRSGARKRVIEGGSCAPKPTDPGEPGGPGEPGEPGLGTDPGPGTPPALPTVPAASVLGTPVASGPAAAAQALLRCERQPVLITDVRRSGGRDRIEGVATTGLAGRSLQVRYQATGRMAGRTTVGSDGRFRVTVRAPRGRSAVGGRARYQALVGTKRSRWVKRVRQLETTTSARHDGGVVVSGRVRSAQRRGERVTLQVRNGCGAWKTTASSPVRSGGRWRATVPLADGATAVALRAVTSVRSPGGRSSRTFTLPVAVG